MYSFSPFYFREEARNRRAHLISLNAVSFFILEFVRKILVSLHLRKKIMNLKNAYFSFSFFVIGSVHI